MTTIGRGSTAKIVGACDDGTVRIYDSVTGVLRLSLRPEFPIQEMTGVPDGSLLVCTHSGRPFITLWDIQTGGLVQTFILKRQAKGTTVSLNGRYLACEASQNTVNLWETASRTQYPAPWEIFGSNTPCWLAPEELIMVVDRGSVCILNVVTKGPPVHKLAVSGSVHNAVYSQIFDQLAIMSLPFLGGNSFTVVDVKTGTFSTLHSSGERLSSIAFSQTTKQLVCGGEVPGLEMVDISTGCWTHFDFPATVTSVSTLSNGTVVANIPGSGIQLLKLDQEHASPTQHTPPTLATYPLDKGRIIAIVPTTEDRVILLETATMLQIFSIFTRKGSNRTVVFHASLENKVALLCFAEEKMCCLQMWEFSHHRPRWTALGSEPPSVGSISPARTRLVTFHGGNGRSLIRVWDAYGGKLMAETSINEPHFPSPLDITFDSENRFYFCYSHHREPYNFQSWTKVYPIVHSVTRLEKQWLDGQALVKRYRLEDREWAFCGSERICWIPPGYIGSAPASYCWAGSSLVVVGQDGTLRKLTFLESSM